MKGRIILLISAAVLISSAVNSQAVSKTGSPRKVALVIGNGNYGLGTLANPENDALLMADALKKLEFDVLVFTNLDWKSMKKSVDDFRVKLKNADVALFFYAGHGVQSGGYNFLMPVDANPQSEAQVEYDCIPADRVMAFMTESGVKIKIMILDACRNNPFEKRWSSPSSAKGLAIMGASGRSNNTYIAYSTAPGSTASDGSGKNSPYTASLAEAILIPDIKINDMFTIVAKNVSQRTGGEQNPWKSDSMLEDFYFNPQSINSSTEGLDYFSDSRDKNNYQILKTNSQIWTKRNLGYTSFNNGDSITEISDQEQWRTFKKPAVLKASPSAGSRSGSLYNYYTVTDVRNICPAGWHVPSVSDWVTFASETGLGVGPEGAKTAQVPEVKQPPDRNPAKPAGLSSLSPLLMAEVKEFISQGSDRGFFTSDGFVVTLNADSLKSDSLTNRSSAHYIRCIRGRNPVAASDSASAILASGATLHGRVNPNLAYTFASFEYGTTSAYGQSVDAEQISVTGSLPADISAKISGLLPGTLYHFRIKAESNAGITYGEERTFTTLLPPYASTEPATSVSSSGASLNGEVNANDAVTEVSFEYGNTTEYGNTVAAGSGIVSGKHKQPVVHSISGLSENTLYHYRVKAVSKAGTTLGNDMTFTTLKLPVTRSVKPTSVTSFSATLQGTVNSSNLPTEITFEYGTGGGFSHTLAGSATPVQSNTDREIGVRLTGLQPGTTYNYRMKAANAAGTTFSNDVSFTTPELAKDADGNTYTALIAGNQVWMAENLRTTRLLDGTEIALVEGEKAWGRQKKAAYCWFNNDTAFRRVTGALYNWYTISTYRLCPAGWHIPTREEWDSLFYYTGDPAIAGEKLKESGTAHWQEPNKDATNESGFTALPGGIRDVVGMYTYYGIKGQWWTADDTAKANAWYQAMDFNSQAVARLNTFKTVGMSVRCVKDRIIDVQSPVAADTAKPVTAEEPLFFIDPRDNRKYQTVRFGNQVWMAENLRATRFTDSTEIPQSVDRIAWTRFESPGFCWYENHEAYSTYGALYNWLAVSSGKLCPVGWHVPSDEEWIDLLKIFGGDAYAGGYLKETGTAHWEKPNAGYSSFNPYAALPGGYRNENGDFLEIGKSGFWWSYLKDNKPGGWYRVMNYANTAVPLRNFRDKPIGLSVRCVRYQD